MLTPENGLSPKSKLQVIPSECLSSDMALLFFFFNGTTKAGHFFLSMGMGDFFRDLKFFQDTEQN